MTALAKRGEIPVFTVGLVAVEMMHGENEGTFNAMPFFAALALPAGARLDACRDLLPIGRIG